MTLVIGVTGAIAAGKSHLARHLVERHGAVHVDADEVVHGMYAPGRPAFDSVLAEFGRGVLAGDGTIDRRALGALVFGQPEQMRRLTAAIGDIDGELREIVEDWRTTLGPDAIAVIEAVHLIEAGYAGWCDASWLVATDPETALRRVMSRNGLTEAEAAQRLASARPWEDRAAASERLFLNMGDLAAFEAEVGAAIEETLAQHRAGTLPPPAWHRWWEETRSQRDDAAS
ncbi:MAG: dephospho-CoA kinase [Dehalococcoidia bacterium]